MAVIKATLAGARVGGVLVDGDKLGAFDLVQNILGAVAMVHVKIEHGHFFDAVSAGGEGGDGDAVEEAKAHGAFLGGMMAGRAEQGKVGLAVAGQLQSAQGTARGAAGVAVDIWIIGSIAIKGAVGLGDELDVGELVGPAQGIVFYGGGFLPGDL